MHTLFQTDSEIPQSKRIVFLGDSITDNGLYIALMEAYFLHHLPQQGLTFINLGVSSETASGLSEAAHPWPRPCVHDRLERALRESRPDWLVLCYGMNDGIYQPFSEERFHAYREGMLRALRLGKQTAEKVIVLTPPPYDHRSKQLHPDYAGEAAAGAETDKGFSWKSPDPGYNGVLRRYANWVLTLADGQEADAAINIHDPLAKDLEELRNDNPDYIYGDGIHPNARGHWIIAKTLLSRLFHVTLERMPDYAADPDAASWFPAVLERHRLLGAAWKEHVGHTNPNKAEEALPLADALVRADALRERILGAAAFGSDAAIPADLKTSDWNGYRRYDFYVGGREAIVVEPKRPASGKPWIWRAEFFDAFAYADRALLEQGWHIAYCRLSHMYGCPAAVRSMESFRKCVTGVFGLAPRMSLFGFSRGGLYAVNYAAAYPQHVSALYLDAPVLDICSWPGGKGAGSGSPAQWEECLAVYGLTEEKAAKEHALKALSHAGKLAAADIPVLLIAGDADTVVPYDENGERFERLYREAEGRIQVIVKPGIGHHPHSLENPEPIVQFIRSHPF
ncbi:Lysophospholipase L1 [Paenibacillus sp. UNCCL117]|uniref:GDSL-type esterase/lipase family protein n=1 Tax=unclassified Paenibacillus TaxID=185978 RepID=UPI0008818C0C|nr:MULTISPECIES: GDSL-type esterase/lipase family protein [unclassified Paenibacillus]SDD56378.1 Lysophospholipase L1 [Paenibacillus sp. cl123]SFW51401.1 Lysophospholipase L1 [Paenibacillus sp. UNCCL117]